MIGKNRSNKHLKHLSTNSHRIQYFETQIRTNVSYWTQMHQHMRLEHHYHKNLMTGFTPPLIFPNRLSPLNAITTSTIKNCYHSFMPYKHFNIYYYAPNTRS